MAVDIRVTKDNCDFSGWATRYNIKCADGRTIRPGAFKDCDGEQITIVYGHKHGLNDILGHGLLESRPEGIRLYGKFNDTEDGRAAKELVKHGDITSLSIYANQLKQNGGDVFHGHIREVSLVLAGANAGAGWHLRLKDARAAAAKDDKPILILFTGPDWSSASKKFESSVLHSKEFDAALRSAVVGLYVQHFVNADAPEEQVSANQSLRKSLSVPAVYPCTVVLASDGKKILGMIPGALDKKAYIEQVAGLAGIALPE